MVFGGIAEEGGVAVTSWEGAGVMDDAATRATVGNPLCSPALPQATSKSNAATTIGSTLAIVYHPAFRRMP
ncbi:MAG: hypothetical protein ACUVSF_05990 [Anaerolineae bacterium]